MDDQQPHPQKSGMLDDLMPASDTPGWGTDSGDPFSVLRKSGGAAPIPPLRTALAAQVGALRQLSEEAEAVLRNPELASTYQPLERSQSGAVIPTGAGKMESAPLPTPTNACLLDMLVGAMRIDNLIGADDTLDAQQRLASRPMPDVLRLFAGDIVIPERHNITATLTRREHHLISMDSAYLPAPAHPQDSEPHDH